METPETMTVRAASTFSSLTRPRPKPTPVEQLRALTAHCFETLRGWIGGHRRVLLAFGAMGITVVVVGLVGPAALARVPRAAPQSSSDDPVLPLTPIAALPLEIGPTAPGPQAPPASSAAIASPAGSPIEAVSLRPASTSLSPVGPTSPTVVVHAAGALVAPGVYRLNDPARVTDVVVAAGGLTGDADPDVLNLAARVGDGERIFVPRRGQSPPDLVVGSTGSGSSAGSALTAKGGVSLPIVDLNVASAEQLDSLPGVGPAIAERIIESRTRLGRFRSVNQLLDVPGIGEAKFAMLKSRVRV